MGIESKDLDGVYGWFRRTSDNNELEDVSIHMYLVVLRTEEWCDAFEGTGCIYGKL